MLTVKQIDAKIAAVSSTIASLTEQVENCALDLFDGAGRGGFVPPDNLDQNFQMADRQLAEKVEQRRRLQFARAAAERNEDGDI